MTSGDKYNGVPTFPTTFDELSTYEYTDALYTFDTPKSPIFRILSSVNRIFKDFRSL